MYLNFNNINWILFWPMLFYLTKNNCFSLNSPNFLNSKFKYKIQNLQNSLLKKRNWHRIIVKHELKTNNKQNNVFILGSVVEDEGGVKGQRGKICVNVWGVLHRDECRLWRDAKAPTLIIHQSPILRQRASKAFLPLFFTFLGADVRWTQIWEYAVAW